MSTRQGSDDVEVYVEFTEVVRYAGHVTMKREAFNRMAGQLDICEEGNGLEEAQNQIVALLDREEHLVEQDNVQVEAFYIDTEGKSDESTDDRG